ncbi:hypothetical protein R5R35_014296 [Gryllus longicercus]|uniref:Uncharacterized protein n=1 Tax=Gryllus longicercus TaxID=2509291 RepID=A0AAN9W1S8_9ORTH
MNSAEANGAAINRRDVCVWNGAGRVAASGPPRAQAGKVNSQGRRCGGLNGPFKGRCRCERCNRLAGGYSGRLGLSRTANRSGKNDVSGPTTPVSSI